MIAWIRRQFLKLEAWRLVREVKRVKRQQEKFKHN